MCGISGIITFAASEEQNEVLLKMARAIAHRGPDDEGFWHSENKQVHFAHRRLSIIDLSSQGHQPMLSNDGRYSIVFNGEIYNYQELRAKCEEKGSYFQTNTDTEVIIEAYRHWGVDCVKRFIGMWAFALYDSFQNRLFISRDLFAIKPLYYGFYNGNLYFGSELKALCEANDAFQEVDEITMRLFLEQGYLERDEWTFYNRIKRFPHAHYVVIDLERFDFSTERLTFHRYWHSPESVLKISFQDAAHQLRHLLKRSISLHLRSDVPVGACLSGGIDSSAIVCIGSEVTSSQWQTFTTQYPNFPEIDESNWAKMAIQYSKANPSFVVPTYEDFISHFDHMLEMQGEPYGSTSIFAQYSIYRHIGKTPVKVILGGQGADEQFGGYVGFLPYFLESLTRNRAIITYIKEGMLLQKNYQLDFKTQLSEKLRYLRKNWQKSAFNCQSLAPSMFALPNWNSTVEGTYEARLEKLNLHQTYFEDHLRGLLTETNIPQLLRYEDRNSMGFSIESRVPFLEKELVEFSLALPATYKIRNGLTKSVLREALTGLIPEQIRIRVDKLGFPAPEKIFLKKAFNLDVPSNGSYEWRKLITEKWLLSQKIPTRV